jgi:hypothetical protein
MGQYHVSPIMESSLVLPVKVAQQEPHTLRIPLLPTDLQNVSLLCVENMKMLCQIHVSIVQPAPQLMVVMMLPKEIRNAMWHPAIMDNFRFHTAEHQSASATLDTPVEDSGLIRNLYSHNATNAQRDMLAMMMRLIYVLQVLML